jgi:hypothetical protein
MSNEPEEDLIEATIRRVAEAKAAREAAEQAGDAVEQPAPEPEEPDVPEPELPAVAAVDAWPEPNGAHAAAPVDEDLIEATIRRVAAARAAKEAEALHDEEPEVPAAPESAGPAIEMPVEEAVAPVIVPRPIYATVSETAPAEPSGDGRWAAEVHALQQEVAAMQGMLRELQARVDAAYAIANASAPVRREAARDDDWDDTPQLPRLPLGQPPRPVLMRNPTPMTATAEHLVEDADAALEAAPETSGEPAPKRGFDLLPRTYRVTVEDKRRGVDLVPLHRALLGMDGVRDMSLLSYSNGVAIISIEMVHELDPEGLRAAVARAMSRDAKVEVHNETTMVVKLAEE